MTSEAIQRMGRELDVSRIEKEKTTPPEFIQCMREMGLFGLIIPPEYGGSGLSNSCYVQLMSEVSMVDGSLSTLMGAHQSIGLKALLLFGTPEQKSKYLPLLATGEMLAAFALTEPEAGSDAGSIRTTARKSEDGNFYILNGSKIWISNGGIASFYTVFARTQHPEAPEGKRDRITCFIVTRDMPGFSSGAEEKKLGLWGSSTTSLSFENVRVPAENVIGSPGEGFKIAMSVLNNGRLGLAGCCALAPRKFIQQARDHATERKQFGKSISEYGLIQSKFSQMATEQYVAEALVRVTAGLMDAGKFDYSLESAICKVFNTETEWRTINECIQIAGGSGYMVEYGYEKILRDSRIFSIWEGANEVLRLFIGLSGIQEPGRRLGRVAQTLKKPLENVVGSIGVLSQFGVRWLKNKVGPVAKLHGAHPVFLQEVEVLESYTAKLARATRFALRKNGKGIVENQFVVKRLADTAIDLFALGCALSRASSAVNEKGLSEGMADVRIVQAFCRKARRRMADNLRRLRKNEDQLEKSIANHLYEVGLPQNSLFQ